MKGFRFVVMALAVGLAGCSDFFVEPGGTTSVALRISPSFLAQADTFKQSDNGILRVIIQADTQKKPFQFAPGQTEVKVRIEIDLPENEVQSIVEVELRRGTDPLFIGRDTLVLKKGVPQPVELQVATVDYCRVAAPYTLGTTVAGQLMLDRDCLTNTGFLASQFALTLAQPTVFEARVSSTAFGPAVAAVTPERVQISGVRSVASPGTVSLEHAFPPGVYWIFATHEIGTAPGPKPGPFTLVTATSTEPQAGKTADTFVLIGSNVTGRVTAADRDDPNDGEPAVTRRFDGYTAWLRPSDTLTVTIRADFRTRVTRWLGSSFRTGHYDIPAGESRSFTTFGPTASGINQHSFYVIAEADQGGGGYTMNFTRGGLPDPIINLTNLVFGTPGSTQTNVQGTLIANYNANLRANSGVSVIYVQVDDVTVCSQAVPATHQGLLNIICPIDTTQRNAAGAPRFPNGSHVVRGLMFAGGTRTYYASAYLPFNVNNAAPPPARVASVLVNPSNASVRIGATQQYTALTRDSANNTLTGRAVTWSSSNTSIATVSSTGLVTGVAPGSAAITATSEGVNGTASVTVTSPVASIDLSPASASLEVNATRQFTATARDAAGAPVPSAVIAWTSSNTAVATVSNTGLVTAVAAGSATITAASDGRSATASVTVTAPCSLRTVSMGQTVSDVIPVSGCRIHTFDLTLSAGTNVAIDRTTGTNEFIITTSDTGGLISTTVGASAKYLNLAAGRYRFEVSGVNTTTSGSYSFTFNTRQKPAGCLQRINSFSLNAVITGTITSNDCTYVAPNGTADPTHRVDDLVRYFEAGQSVTLSLSGSSPVGFELRRDTSPQVIVGGQSPVMSATATFTIPASGFYMILVSGPATVTANYTLTVR